MAALEPRKELIRKKIAAVSRYMSSDDKYEKKKILDSFAELEVGDYILEYLESARAHRMREEEENFFLNLGDFIKAVEKESCSLGAEDEASYYSEVLGELQKIKNHYTRLVIEPMMDDVASLRTAAWSKEGWSRFSNIKKFYQEFYLPALRKGTPPHKELGGNLKNLLEALKAIPVEQKDKALMNEELIINRLLNDLIFCSHPLIKEIKSLNNFSNILRASSTMLTSPEDIKKFFRDNYLFALTKFGISPHPELETFLNNLEDLIELTSKEAKLEELTKQLVVIQKIRDKANQEDFVCAQKIQDSVNKFLRSKNNAMRKKDASVEIKCLGFKLARNSSDLNSGQISIDCELSITKHGNTYIEERIIPIEELLNITPDINPLLINSYRYFPSIGIVQIPRKSTLGAGAFGKAKVAKLDYLDAIGSSAKKYIIKIIKLRGKTPEAREWELKDIDSECKILNNLGRTSDFYHGRGKVTMITERAPGITLEKWLSTNQPELQKANAAIALFQEVQAMHKKGIIHRDLKPANIMIDPKTLRVTIIDLGFAVKMNDSGIANDGRVCGTPRYLPPSKCVIVDDKPIFTKDYNYTAAHDWYAVGKTLEKMKLGQHSFLLQDPPQVSGDIIAQFISQLQLSVAEKEELSRKPIYPIQPVTGVIHSSAAPGAHPAIAVGGVGAAAHAAAQVPIVLKPDVPAIVKRSPNVAPSVRTLTVAGQGGAGRVGAAGQAAMLTRVAAEVGKRPSAAPGAPTAARAERVMAARQAATPTRVGAARVATPVLDAGKSPPAVGAFAQGLAQPISFLPKRPKRNGQHR